jgi:hypothetical protein
MWDLERDPVALEASPFRIFTWLRLHGVDIFTLAVIGALCLVVHVSGGCSYVLRADRPFSTSSFRRACSKPSVPNIQPRRFPRIS